MLNSLMTQVRFTYEDLQLFPDDGLRRELLDGEVYVTRTPNIRHQRVVTNLAFRVGRYLHDNPLGEVLVAPVDVIFSENADVTEPDILYVSNERASIISERGLEGAPDWLIEVTSPSTRKRDFTLKRSVIRSTACDFTGLWTSRPRWFTCGGGASMGCLKRTTRLQSLCSPALNWR